MPKQLMDPTISDAEFWELVNATSVGRHGKGANRTSKSLEACYLYMVTGGRSKRECARLAGISSTAAIRAINRLIHEMENPSKNEQRLCFKVPTDLVDEVTTVVEQILKANNKTK